MFSKKTAGAVFVSLAMTVASGAALAQPANTETCLKLSHQVADALDSHQDSANLQAAKDQQSIGKNACMSGMFAEGASHYQSALQLLGVTMANAK